MRYVLREITANKLPPRFQRPQKRKMKVHDNHAICDNGVDRALYKFNNYAQLYVASHLNVISGVQFTNGHIQAREVIRGEYVDLSNFDVSNRDCKSEQKKKSYMLFDIKNDRRHDGTLQVSSTPISVGNCTPRFFHGNRKNNNHSNKKCANKLKMNFQNVTSILHYPSGTDKKKTYMFTTFLLK